MIYLGHLGNAAGAFYTFVFRFHVPFFFFLSGCTDRIGTQRTPLATAKHRAKTILLPWLVFALLNLVVWTIYYGKDITDVRQSLSLIVTGTIRNQYSANGALWFLTCLFVMSCAFAWIKKLKYPALILGVSAVLHMASQYLLPNNPIAQPSLPWNVDSAMYYMIYYAIGYTVFPALDKWIKKGSLSLWIVGVVTFVYAACLFFGKNLLSGLKGYHFLLDHLLSISQCCLLILFFFLVAYALQRVAILNAIGKNSLFLCGSETMVQLIWLSVLNTFGLSRGLSTPLSALVYVAVIQVITNRYVVPVEKELLQGVENGFHNFAQNLKIRRVRQ